MNNKETLNKAILNSLSAHIAVLDKSGKIIATNKAWETFALNNPTNSIEAVSIGDNYLALLKKLITTDSYIKKTYKGLVLVMSGKDNYFSIDFPRTSINGKRWDNIKVTPHGKDGSVVISFTNITKTILVEEALKESETKFKDLFEKSGDAILIIENRSFVECNQATVKMLKYKNKEEFLNVHPSQLSPEKQPDGMRSEKKAELMMDLAVKNGTHRFEWEHVKKDGEVFPVEVLLTVISDTKNKEVIHTVWRDITERKLAEEVLKVERDKFNFILNDLPIGVSVADADHNFAYINPVSNKIDGYPKESLNIIGKNVVSIHPKNSQSKVEQLLKDFESGEISFFERESKRGKRTINISYHAIRDSQRKYLGMVRLVYDITERKRAEEALKIAKEKAEASEKFLKETQLIASLGTYTLDISSGNWTCSEVLDTIFGIDASYDKSVEGWASLIHPDWQKIMNAYFSNEVLGNKTKFDKEYKIVRHNDKTERWVHGIGNLKLDDNNQPIKMIGTIKDITERKHVEQKIIESEERYRSLFDKMNEGLLIEDKEGSIKIVNPRFGEIIGYEQHELIGENVNQLLVERSSRPLMETKNKERASGLSDNYDIQMITKLGERVWLNISSSPKFTSTGKYDGSISIVTDISDIRKAEQEKFKAIFKAEEREQNRLAIDLHDGVGQTIAAANMHINALTEMVKEQLDAETLETFMATKKLVNDATVETRFVSHNIMPPSLKEFGIEQSITTLLGNYQKIKTDIAIKIESNIGTKRFNGEIELTVYRCVKEIISNTIKHAKAKTIKIALNTTKKQLSVKISDNGIGFDLTHVELNKDGIGLTNLSNRVKSLGGEFLIETAPNKGTKISFVLKIKD